MSSNVEEELCGEIRRPRIKKLAAKEI